MPETIRVAGIVPESITDGPGIRFTLFLQGCPRRCEGCHNPAALPFDGGVDMTAEEILSKIKKNPLLSGVTFSGGEPFEQSAALLPLAKAVKEAGLELAIYTGYLFEELMKDQKNDKFRLLQYPEIVVDGPFVLAKRNLLLHFRGSSNQRIIDVKRSLEAGEAMLEKSERWVGDEKV